MAKNSQQMEQNKAAGEIRRGRTDRQLAHHVPKKNHYFNPRVADIISWLRQNCLEEEYAEESFIDELTDEEITIVYTDTYLNLDPGLRIGAQARYDELLRLMPTFDKYTLMLLQRERTIQQCGFSVYPFVQEGLRRSDIDTMQYLVECSLAWRDDMLVLHNYSGVPALLKQIAAKGVDTSEAQECLQRRIEDVDWEKRFEHMGLLVEQPAWPFDFVSEVNLRTGYPMPISEFLEHITGQPNDYIGDINHIGPADDEGRQLIDISCSYDTRSRLERAIRNFYAPQSIRYINNTQPSHILPS